MIRKANLMEVKEFIGKFQSVDDLLELINQYFETQVNE